MMNDPPELQSGEVEADETWIGGRRNMRHKKENKTIVFGSVKRKGKVQAQIIKDTSEESLLRPLRQQRRQRHTSASLMNGERIQSIANIEGFKHETVKHSAKQYRKGNAYTNTIEGFWSQL